MSDLKLFTPIKVGSIELKNRLVMAPLTRSRATGGDDAPNELHVEYYSQRAGAGLIITEAAQISQQGKGYPWTAGIYLPAQIEGWRKVTRAVHDKGGKIVLQLMHVGRVSHPMFQENEQAPVAPSAIQAKTQTYDGTQMLDTALPRELGIEEIPGVVADFVKAAENAKEAGFDGVEVHGANGYLIDQFLRDGSNKRTDAYGGPVENRARLLLEVLEAVTKVFEAGRVGLRLSPFSNANDIEDSNPQETFAKVIDLIKPFGLAYLHLVEGQTGGPRDLPEGAALDALYGRFEGTHMGNNGYDRQMAVDAVEEGRLDLVAFGRLYIANPDLEVRLEKNAPLNDLDPDTLYGGGAKGYTDYPTLVQSAVAAE